MLYKEFNVSLVLLTLGKFEKKNYVFRWARLLSVFTYFRNNTKYYKEISRLKKISYFEKYLNYTLHTKLA